MPISGDAAPLTLADLLRASGGEPSDPVLDIVRRARNQERLKAAGIGEPLSMGDFARREVPTALLGLIPAFGRALPAMVGGAAMFGAPSQAGGPAAEGPDLTRLYQDQAALQKQMEEAMARRESFRPKKGRKPTRDVDPQFTAADDEWKALDTRARGLQKQIETLETRNTPAAKLQAERAKREDAEAARRKSMNTSVKETFADVAPYIPAASGVLAALLGAKIKSAHVDKFNTNMRDLTGRWEGAVQQGNKPLAQELGRSFDALNKAGPGGTLKALGAGAIVGELGQLGPVMADYSKALPGSDLYKNTSDTMSNWKEVAGRVLSGLAWGAGPAEIGALWASRGRVKPLGYGAETRAMPELLAPNPRSGALQSTDLEPLKLLGSASQGGPPAPPALAALPKPEAPSAAQSSRPRLAERVNAARQSLPPADASSPLSLSSILQRFSTPANKNNNHHSAYQPRENGKFSGPPKFPTDE